MQKTFTVEVNAPVINITVIVDTVGTVNVTVNNNATVPTVIAGATVTIGNISAITNNNGIAVLYDVPMETHTGTVTTP